MGPDAVRSSLLSYIDRTFKVYISRFAEPGKSKKEADRVDKKRVDDVVWNNAASFEIFAVKNKRLVTVEDSQCHESNP